MSADKRLYLIDGSGYIFRAFHALPMFNRPSDGTPVNAVMGFCNMFLKLLTDFHAGQIAVIFDASRTNFRNDIYAEYKTNRSETPEELIPQFPIIREAVEAFSLPSLEMEGYEADDLIATYARLAVERGQEVTIVSSDKDLMQLIRPGVEMFDPIKIRTIGPPEVFEKFGVTPDKMVEVQALIGDSVDNVPGIPGIGPKTAAQLIGEFGDLENLLANAHTIKQEKRRESLITYADQARLSKRLVILDDHAPVPAALEDLVVHPFDPDKLIAFCRRQGFKTIIGRLEAQGVRPTAPQGVEEEIFDVPFEPLQTTIAEAPVAAYELVTDITVLERWISAATVKGHVALAAQFDATCACLSQLVGLSLAIEPGRACYIPLCHVAPESAGADTLSFAPPPKQIALSDAADRLRPLLADKSVLKIGHDLKSLSQVLHSLHLLLTPYDDVQLLSYALDGTTKGNSIPELAEAMLSHTTIPWVEVIGSGKAKLPIEKVAPEKAMPHAAEEADMLLRLHALFKARLVPERMVTLYEVFERPLVPVVADMERTGIKVDLPTLRDLSARFEERLARLEGEIQGEAGREFNIGSPKQLGEVLFGELKIEGGKKTKTGEWSTDASILEPLVEAHPVIAKVLEWRGTSKLKNTYTDALQEDIAHDGRVHTSYSLAATNTGRLSSTAPNLQNIPIRSDEGKEIRRAFIADAGHRLLSIDYSQIELRLAAEIAGITALAEACRNGDDIHALTASQVFEVPMANMTADLRRAAKAINFGIIYGISGFGLAAQLGISSGEAAGYIRQYLDRFAELRVYMDETKAFARRTGYVETLFGRKCHMPGINDKNPARRQGAERQAINARLQGTAADIMRLAMIRVDQTIRREKLPARLLLQVHDELVLEVPETYVEEVATRLVVVMEGVATLGVPLVCEAGNGLNWGAAH